MSVYINSTWQEIEWWEDSTNDPNQKVRWRAIARCTQNVGDNDSDVYFRVQRRITNGSAGWADYPADKTMRITGTGASSDTHSATMTWKFGYATSTSWADAEGDYSDAYWSKVKHNADGTLTIRAHITGDRVVSGSIDTYVDLVLPTIPRASTATFDTNEITLNGTNKFTITINRASSSFTHTLKFERSTASTTITGVGASTTFQPSVSKWMPVCGSKKNSVTVTLTTYSGSTKIGDSKTYTIYLNVDQSAYKPVINSVTLSDSNTTTAALENSGSYIKGKSNLKAVVVFGVSNTSYVSLVGATITCGNDTRSIRLSGTSSTQTVTFTGISSSNFRVTVTDARGVTATSTRTLTIIPYTNINITSASYTRVNDSGESTEVGSHIKLRVVTSGFVGTFGQSNNVQTLSYRYKLKSSSTWSSYISLGTYSSSSTGSVSTHTFNVQPTQTFSYSSQYDVQVRVVDTFSNKTLSIVIHQGLPVTAYGADHFDVYGNFHIHDREDPTTYTSIGAVGYMPPAVVLTDCDNATQYGVRYRATNTTANTPISAYFHIYVFPYSTNYMTQVAFHTNTQGSRIWVRSNNDSGWGAWRELTRNWKLIGTATGSSSVSISTSGYSEVMAVVKYAENANNVWTATTSIPVSELTANGVYLMMPARIYSQTANDRGCLVHATTTAISIYEFFNNRASVSNATLSVYMR